MYDRVINTTVLAFVFAHPLFSLEVTKKKRILACSYGLLNTGRYSTVPETLHAVAYIVIGNEVTGITYYYSLIFLAYSP